MKGSSRNALIRREYTNTDYSRPLSKSTMYHSPLRLGSHTLVRRVQGLCIQEEEADFGNTFGIGDAGGVWAFVERSALNHIGSERSFQRTHICSVQPLSTRASIFRERGDGGESKM